ncbi:serine/threonine-protein kinase [Streptomyces canus]|uniref:serine/threonine-protein kinase n=1 Tax=Streptomyces canus TaxID=58343 RepID=UPI0030E59B19
MTRDSELDRAQPHLAGRYRLLELIGRGGMGQVWRARDEVLDREVAVKEMGPAALSASDTDRRTRRERARREARAAARIDHPNVVRIYDVIPEDDRLWIVMELVKGPSLDDVVSDGPVSAREAVRIGLELAKALQRVHEAGIVHRDIKPANVHLAPDGRVVLMDFGIAALQDTDTTLTTTGGLIGTAGYMAPERLTGGPERPASDLWSLGATLYYARTGRTLFERSSALATLRAVMSEDPEIGEATGPLRPLLTALLRRKPEERPTASEAVDRLTELSGQADLTVPSGADGPVAPQLVESRTREAFFPIANSSQAAGEPDQAGGGAAQTKTKQPGTTSEGRTPHEGGGADRTREASPGPEGADRLGEAPSEGKEANRPGDALAGNGPSVTTVDSRPVTSPPPPPHPPRPPLPRPDPSVPRSYIPRKPVTSFARRTGPTNGASRGPGPEGPGNDGVVPPDTLTP